jgi:hypothetical protein
MFINKFRKFVHLSSQLHLRILLNCPKSNRLPLFLKTKIIKPLPNRKWKLALPLRIALCQQIEPTSFKTSKLGRKVCVKAKKYQQMVEYEVSNQTI